MPGFVSTQVVTQASRNASYSRANRCGPYPSFTPEPEWRLRVVKPGSAAQKRKSARDHRIAACDYRFVWRIAPAHQREGWRRAAITHEQLIRAYMREIRALEPSHG